MPKLIIHKEQSTFEEIEERRFLEDQKLTSKERLTKMFNLMALSFMFKNGPLKKPQGLGIILKKDQK